MPTDDATFIPLCGLREASISDFMPKSPCVGSGCRLESPPNLEQGMSSQAHAADRQGFRRDLAKRAVALAMKSRWAEAVNVNRAILAEFPNDVEAYNRMAKALAEVGRVAEARAAFARVLDLSPHNAIAKKNLERLGKLADGEPGPAPSASGARRVFIEESGKSGVTTLINLGPAADLLKEAPGHQVTLSVDGRALKAHGIRDCYLGQVEPRLGSRLIRLMRGGNRYEAAVKSVGEGELAILIREVFQHPSQSRSVSFHSHRSGNRGGHRDSLIGMTSGGSASKGEVTQYETLAAKDWSSDDTEPGDDEAFSPVLHGVLDPASGQVDSVSGQEDELVY